MKFSHDYPYSPPTFRFITKMFHSNIYEVMSFLRLNCVPSVLFPSVPSVLLLFQNVPSVLLLFQNFLFLFA